MGARFIARYGFRLCLPFVLNGSAHFAEKPSSVGARFTARYGISLRLPFVLNGSARCAERPSSVGAQFTARCQWIFASSLRDIGRYLLVHRAVNCAPTGLILLARDLPHEMALDCAFHFLLNGSAHFAERPSSVGAQFTARCQWILARSPRSKLRSQNYSSQIVSQWG